MDHEIVRKPTPTLGIVIPVYNEEDVINKTVSKLEQVFQELILEKIILENSFILFVDDGSKDSTWRIIKELFERNEYFRGIKLSRNHGHQNALLAGLLTAKDKADCVISMDADLQDDINLIREFVCSYLDGYELVYAIRKERKTDTFFKRKSASLFYSLMQKIGIAIKHNHADYRLASKQVLEQLADFNEANIFLRGIFPLIGFPSKEIYYNRQERAAGITKYPFKKMLSFAIEGITSFSNIPLRVITILGLIIFLFSLFMSLGVLIEALLLHNVVRGWSSIALSIYMLSGIQLLCLGVIGEYIGKIYSETKRRPRFIIEQKLI